MGLMHVSGNPKSYDVLKDVRIAEIKTPSQNVKLK